MIKIYIDQGHNPVGVNAGAEGNGVREQDINYAVGIRLGELLRANGNFEVQLSRNTPEQTLGNSNITSLAYRANSANEWGADYFISIHANSSSNTAASGSEAYVYAAESKAAALAEKILEGLHETTELADRGVFVNKSLYVLRRTRMPAVLVELGYVSNIYDAELMVTRPDLFADGIYQGILRYFGL